VSSAARVSLGYLSEVERGQKEASSELLSAICDALELRLSDVLGEVTEGMRRAEQDVPVRHELSKIRRMPAVLPAADRRAGQAGEAALEPPATDGAETAPVAEVPAAPVAEVPAVQVAEVSQVSGVSQVSRRYVLEPAGGDSREVLAAVLGTGPGRVIAA
jgi:hypothetical protein